MQFLKKDIGENPIFGPIGIQEGLNFQKNPLSSLLQNAWVMKPHRAHVSSRLLTYIVMIVRFLGLRKTYYTRTGEKRTSEIHLYRAVHAVGSILK